MMFCIKSITEQNSINAQIFLMERTNPHSLLIITHTLIKDYGSKRRQKAMQRTFQMDGEWNIVYYPDKPSGFSVLIIGDHQHFVDENSSFWLEHPGRLTILNAMRHAGYTIFSSNFYGENWGNAKAISLAKRLYFIVMKSEVLNEKIHIFAEGKGALLALQIIKGFREKVRSVVLVNPCLSLKMRIQQEKEHKFYYKKILSEICEAHETTPEELERSLISSEDFDWSYEVPLKIFHVIGSVEDDQSCLYKLMEKKAQERNAIIDVEYLLGEKRYKIPFQTIKFFQQFENDL